MTLSIEQVERDSEGVATWFLGRYTVSDVSRQGSFHVHDVAPDEGGEMAMVSCSYHQWGTPLHGLFVCLTIHRSEDAWSILGLDHASRIPKDEPVYRGTCHDFARWAEARHAALSGT